MRNLWALFEISRQEVETMDERLCGRFRSHSTSIRIAISAPEDGKEGTILGEGE